MISEKLAVIINHLPKKVAKYITNKIMGGYVDKYANITVEGMENLTDITKPTIFVCNHLSNSDGLLLSRTLKSIDPTFVAGIKLTKNAVTNLGGHIVKCTNINPNGTDTEGLKRIIKLVKQGESLLIFPEGTRSRVGSLIEPKKGAVLIVAMTNAPIIPIGISGSEKLMPINKEGDMSAENFQYADVKIHIGKQFELMKRQKGQNKKEYEEYAIDYIMTKIAELLPEEYRGVYKDAVKPL